MPVFSCLAGPFAPDAALAFGQRFVQRRFGLLQGDARAATVDFLAGKTLGRDFDITGQQHHVRVGNRCRAQRIARTDRALGFDLQVIAQSLGRLLQGFSGHESMSNAGRTRGDRDQARRAFGNGCRFDGGFGCGVNLRFFGTASQHRFDILQGVCRSALEHTLADESRHIHRRAGDQQHPLGGLDRGRRQLAFRVRHIHHFDTGAPALTLRRGIEQAGAQHAGDHAVGASRNDG
jgi:hypothetical protein